MIAFLACTLDRINECFVNECFVAGRRRTVGEDHGIRELHFDKRTKH